MDKQGESSFPKGVFAFENQVAGHTLKNGKRPVGILKQDGVILKPLTKHPMRECEINFYEQVFHGTNSEMAQLRSFVPSYFGTTMFSIGGQDIQFLKLEDITSNSAHPCVMDIKMGARTWEPTATEQKRLAEEAKYRETKGPFGFCIPGYQVYDLEKETIIKQGRESGKLLNIQSLPLAFKEFLNYNSGLAGIVIDSFLTTLRNILVWFHTQKSVHIYSSSLLLYYDAEHLIKLKNNQVDEKPWNRIFMIDFAHVVPAQNSVDENYINGLTKLIEFLQNL